MKKTTTTADTEFTFNFDPLDFGPTLAQPTETDFPETCYKTADYAFVYRNTNAYVRAVLDAVGSKLALSKRKRFLVDIKVHDLEQGKFACIPGWHCDSVIDPRHETPGEVHHLFVSGGAGLTEFIAEPVTLTLPSGLKGRRLLSNMQAQLEGKTPQVVSVPSCQVVTYGRWDFHRATKALYNERRLLVRITETDLISPHNRPFICKNYEGM